MCKASDILRDKKGSILINSKYVKFLTLLFWTFSLCYVLYLTYLSVFWRIDPHHDGYVYLSAYLGTAGKLPPTVTNHHGIASAFIESKILLMSTTSLLSYRFIGLAVICMTAFLIFKIIALKLDKKSALAFSLLWLSANPSWVASIMQTPKALQSIWPNLWVQLFTLGVLYILFCNRKILPVNQVLIGAALATLPFFRIQGIVILMVLLIYILNGFKKYLPLILVSMSITMVAWLSLIQSNGGIQQYLDNILLTPLSKKDYEEFITLNAILFNFTNKFKYYLVVLIIFLILMVAASFFRSFVESKISSSKRLLVLSVLLLALTALTMKNSDIWVNTIYVHSTTLLIDLSLPAALLYLGYVAKKHPFNKKMVNGEDLNVTILLAIIVIVNVLNQFPLSDRGHKWWSAAPSLILLAYLANKRFDDKKFNINVFNFRSFVYLVSILTISLSMVEGRVFQQISRTEIRNYDFASFNGITYPQGDSELVKNLLKSVEILSQLEARGIVVSYICDDGLYYMRSGDVSPAAISGLTKNREFVMPKIDSIVFICHNSKRDHISRVNTNDLNIYTIGTDSTDSFIVNKDSKLNTVLKNLMK